MNVAMSSTRFGDFFARHRFFFFYDQKTCFGAYFGDVFDIICYVYICYACQPFLLLYYLQRALRTSILTLTENI